MKGVKISHVYIMISTTEANQKRMVERGLNSQKFLLQFSKPVLFYFCPGSDSHGWRTKLSPLIWKSFRMALSFFSTFLSHLSHTDDILLCDVRCPSCVNIFSRITGPNLLCSICRVRRQEILNFMTSHSKGT